VQEDGWALACRLPEEAVEGTARIRSQRSVVKVPSRTLRSDRTQCGSKKPINGVYKSSEYRKPSKGFDLPKVGSAVLDLGAHVGWFTLWCLDNGADKVVAVEATPASHSFHATNFKDDPRVESIHAAVVSHDTMQSSPSLTFRIAPGGNNWRNCVDRYTYWNDETVAKMGRVTVPTTSVEKILAEHPDIHMVKIDIEGSEMELLETVVWPEHVRYLVFEYSIGTRADATSRFPPIREKLELQGFRVQFAPSFWQVVKGKKNAVYDEIVFCKRDVGRKFFSTSEEGEEGGASA